MALSPMDFSPLMLAARAAEAMSLAHAMAYVQLAPDLTAVQASPNFAELLQNLDEEIAGQPITNLLWEFVGAEEALYAVLRGETPLFRLEQVDRSQDSTRPIYLNFQVTPLDASHPNQGLLVVVEDVTDYGRLHQALVQDRNELRLVQGQLTDANAELKRLNRLKSIFLSMAAHDLRTPLTAISGYAGLMLDLFESGQTPNVIEYLNIVLTQADRLNKLISDFLDMDQIEDGRLNLKQEWIDLGAIVRGVTAVMQINADSRQITLDTDLPELPLQLWADEDKVSRIVYNLVSNAIKYTPREGRVFIQARQKDDQITLKVLDNGRGMTEAQLANLFQLYYRTDEARKSKTRGTGLGLYIVKMLVEAHQGQITVSSKPKVGSIFAVTLPQQPPIDA